MERQVQDRAIREEVVTVDLNLNREKYLISAERQERGRTVGKAVRLPGGGGMSSVLWLMGKTPVSRMSCLVVHWDPVSFLSGLLIFPLPMGQQNRHFLLVSFYLLRQSKSSRRTCSRTFPFTVYYEDSIHDFSVEHLFCSQPTQALGTK